MCGNSVQKIKKHRRLTEVLGLELILEAYERTSGWWAQV